MSNIYIQEPPTSGKVLLKTTVGDIDIELWSKECPKACRNFIQLCMEGYYNGTIFHRVVKGFIVQGGDPNGDGTGGESIYGQPFKDEFHSRLRYIRRGLVGMANSDTDDNGSQFFFTMGPTPELQNKNTLFGKVTGDTVYNMLKLEDGLVDHNERPMYPQKIIRTEILSNPYDDIKTRVAAKEKKKDKSKQREKGVKNFGLLSFGEEAEEDEAETNNFVQTNSGKAKSMHDRVDDPKLSKQAIKLELADGDDETLQGDKSIKIKEEADDAFERMSRIKNKLNTTRSGGSKSNKPDVKIEVLDSDEDVLMTLDEEKKIQSERRKNEIRTEIHSLKKQYQNDKKTKDELLEKKVKPETKKDLPKSSDDNQYIKNFIEEKEKYSALKSKIPKKGASREELTLSLLSKFRAKLQKIRHDDDEDEVKQTANEDAVVEEEIKGDAWLKHTFQFQEAVPVLAKDASTKNDDWYDVYDPRNPLNKRKRGEVKNREARGSKRLK